MTRRSGGAVDVDLDRVVWKFRFEYQFDRSEAPWWRDMNDVGPRPAPVLNADNDPRGWPLTSSGPTVTYTSSDDIKRIDNDSETAGREAGGDAKVYECQACKGRSSRPYSGRALCLNEACKEWDIVVDALSKFLHFGLHLFSRPEHNLASFLKNSQAGIDRQRITAKSLRMDLRPPEPIEWDARVNQPADFGREYWTGWVCGSCGCASERKKWYGWTCESCGVSTP